ncbi:conserved hypothetical protein [Solidesulfovibrio fructosivorans JJ]]|uniref:Uncharacterized protein n=1 Tax=Solidesulfovibrio fructosivorans JJ] TaxID=596151 RepID=E1JRB6_SOLFR|nr:hypothetical protein [Solidesulfovibrio fructosivorans]EFL53117.1 conserved hypothetical protein [Solidesulfovibrio fructosivorans JJ]]
MRLTVTRGDGVSPAPDELTAELACSEAPATQAGRNYLDEYGQDAAEVDVTCMPESSVGVLLPGELVEIDDGPAAETWRATVTGIEITLAVADSGAATLTQTLTVERPLE